ncbi:MAG: hypothetical protein ACLQU9_04480 [Acidimicrobiales bacterium]|jgi:hypothetical protein
MNVRELAEIRRAIASAAAGEPELVRIGPIEATRGWGDILFVRVQAQLRGPPSAEMQEEVERRFQAALRETFDGDRCAVSVRWVSD